MELIIITIEKEQNENLKKTYGFVNSKIYNLIQVGLVSQDEHKTPSNKS